MLVACILSLRTQDTTTGPASERLFAVAKTPATMLRLTPRAIERLIYPVGFYRTKARVILGLCRDLLARWDGRVPDTIDALLTLKGVGRKTANLVVTMGYGRPGICVDTHVHRISNRLGYVRTKSPDETEMALRATTISSSRSARTSARRSRRVARSARCAVSAAGSASRPRADPGLSPPVTRPARRAPRAAQSGTSRGRGAGGGG